MAKKNCNDNYLDRVSMRPENIKWSSDEKGIVTLKIENKGLFHFLAQKLLGKPKSSYIHLDEIGSVVWGIMDGKMSLADIGVEVKNQLGDKANPLYERLVKYMQILDSYGFVKWV